MMGIINLILNLNEYSQLLLVMFTAILAVVTGIYAYFIYQSFRLSTKSYEIRNKPYFLIMKDVSLPLKGGGTNFVFNIKNCGNTPAQLISHEIVFLKCTDPGEVFSDPYDKREFNQRAFLPPGESTQFEVSNLSNDKKVGLEIKTKYVGVYFKKTFESRALFKLEGRIVYPIDSSLS